MSTYFSFPQVFDTSENGQSIIPETSSLDETASSVEFDIQNEVFLQISLFNI